MKKHLPKRAPVVAVLSKKTLPAAAHLVRAMYNLSDNEFVCWLVYTGQLPAIVERMQRELTRMRAVTLTGVKGDTKIVRALLAAIGLPTEGKKP